MASRGAELHATAAAHIGDAFEGIEQKIGQLSEVSIECLSLAELLYDNISYPLSATLCHSENKPRATIANHLSMLHEELTSASDKLRSLHSEWQNCVMSQHEAWQELSSPVSEVRKREIGFGEYEKEAKAVARAADQDLDALDTVCRPPPLGQRTLMFVLRLGVQGTFSSRDDEDNATNHGRLKEQFYNVLFFFSCLSLLCTLISWSAIDRFHSFLGLAP